MLEKPKTRYKDWGRELWLHNSENYAFKILEFKHGGQSCLHFHMQKTETWFVESGRFEIVVVDGKTARHSKRKAAQGHVFHILPGMPHQVKCLKTGRIFVASTQSFDDDGYRIDQAASCDTEKAALKGP